MTYNYENGAYTTINFTWNDAKKVLTINDRKCSFPGMTAERKFNIIQVRKNNGAGMDISEKPFKEVVYTGKKVSVKFDNQGRTKLMF